MFYSIIDLCYLCIVEAVDSANEVASYSSNPLKLHSLADFSVYVLNLLYIHNFLILIYALLRSS